MIYSENLRRVAEGADLDCPEEIEAFVFGVEVTKACAGGGVRVPLPAPVCGACGWLRIRVSGGCFCSGLVSWLSVFVYIVARDFGMNGILSGCFWGSFRCFAVFPYVGRMTPPPPFMLFFIALMCEGSLWWWGLVAGFFRWRCEALADSSSQDKTSACGAVGRGYESHRARHLFGSEPLYFRAFSLICDSQRRSPQASRG